MFSYKAEDSSLITLEILKDFIYSVFTSTSFAYNLWGHNAYFFFLLTELDASLKTLDSNAKLTGLETDTTNPNVNQQATLRHIGLRTRNQGAINLRC